MRRVMLLALLALALPMAVSADQIRYNTGVPAQNATATLGNFAGPAFTVSVSCPSCSLADPATMIQANISLSISDLTGCATAPAVCMFGTGTVTVRNSTGQLFSDSILNNGTGSIIRNANSVVIHAEVTPTQFIPSGEVNFGLEFNNGSLVGANGAVLLNTEIPEPGTLGMLSTGLVGLAGLARRRLKLPI